MAIQKHEDEKLNEIIALEESNKALKKRALELETAVREKDKAIAELKTNSDWLRQQLLDATSAKPITPPTEPPREARPIGAGMSKEAVTAMAMAAVTGDPKRRK